MGPQPLDPRRLLEPFEPVLRLEREVEETLRVALSKLLEAALRARMLESVLADGFEHRQPELSQDLRRRQYRKPRRHELDCERKPVEPSADLLDGCEHVVLQEDPARGRELDEERRRVVDRQRPERKHVLGRETLWRAARSQNLQIRDEVDQCGDVRRGRGEMLEVVEVEERTRAVEGVRYRLEHAPCTRLTRAHRACDRARDELGVHHRGKTDEVYRTIDRCSRRDLEGEPALPGASWSNNGDQAHALGEQSLDARERVRTSDEAMMERRQAGRRQRLQRREGPPGSGRDGLEKLNR